MRLIVAAPSGWHVQERGATKLLVRGEPTQPTATAEIPPIASVPDENETWVRVTLARDLAPPAKLQVVRSSELEGRDGWKAQLLSCTVVREAGPIEHRLGVYLRLLYDLGLCVVVRARSGDELDAAAAELLPCLAAARPDWRAGGEVIAISDLYAV